MFEPQMHPSDTLLNEYLDNELDSSEKISLETHLAACTDCQGRMAELRELFQQIGSLPDLAPSYNLAPRVMETLPRPIEIPLRRRVLTFATFLQIIIAITALLWLIHAGSWQNPFQPLHVDIRPAVLLERLSQTVSSQYHGWLASGSKTLTGLAGEMNSFQQIDLLPQMPVLGLGIIAGIATLLWLFGNSILIASFHSQRRH